jgi:acyl-CoA synthetase (AMP-forming)/AMP-acid ligase II
MAYDKGMIDPSLQTDYLEIMRTIFGEGFGLGVIPKLVSCSQPDLDAVVGEHRTLTYEEFNDEINRVANVFMEKYGVGPGSKVLLMMENRTEYLCSWLALSRIDASAVHASYRLTEDELKYQIEHSQGNLIVTSDGSLPTVLSTREELTGRTLKVISVDDVDGQSNVSEYHQLIADANDSYPEVRGDHEPENIVYTSGTTGKPKGASRDLNTPGELLDKLGLFSELSGLLEVLPVECGDRQLIVTPVYHSAGQAFSFIQMAMSGTIFLRPKFDARDAVEKLDEWDINNTVLVPTLIRRILNLPDEVLDQYSFEALRGIVVTAAPFPQELRETAIERFGADKIHELYGATELGLITHIDGNGMLDRPKSVGKPLPGQEVKIINDDGEEADTGEVGEVFVRNEEVMEGYLDNEEATENILDGDWMTCEDLGYFDEDGYLYLTGRARDMVITGGVNVYPVEVENAINRHDDVDESAVIGVDDPEWGERLIGFVVPDDEEVDFDDLDVFARENLHRAKVPKEWYAIDEFPRTDTGKILKRELEERYEDGDFDVEEFEQSPVAKE